MIGHSFLDTIATHICTHSSYRQRYTYKLERKTNLKTRTPSTGVPVFSLMEYAGYLQRRRVEMLLSLEASDKVTTSKSLITQSSNMWVVHGPQSLGRWADIPAASVFLASVAERMESEPARMPSWQRELGNQLPSTAVSQLAWLPPSSGTHRRRFLDAAASSARRSL